MWRELVNGLSFWDIYRNIYRGYFEFGYVYLFEISPYVSSKQKNSEKTETKVRNIITIVSVLLVLSLFIGLIFLLPDDAAFNAIGKYMTFIPLSIIGLQVVLSIVVMIAKLVKRYKKWWGIFFVNTPPKQKALRKKCFLFWNDVCPCGQVM